MSKLDEFIEECLREHNCRRALHGVQPLKHSRSLDKTAQDWCEELITEESVRNSPLSSRGDVGESISMRTSTSSRVDIRGSEVVAQWYADIKNYDFVTGKGPSGNFTQLVWSGTREVGFGKARIAGKCVVVAHYRPPGNVRGHYQTNVPPPTDQSNVSFADPTNSNGSKPDPSAKRSIVTETVKEPSGRKYTVRREIIESTEPSGRIKRCVNETYSDITETEFTGSATDASPLPPHEWQPKSDVDVTVQSSAKEDFLNSVVRAHNIHRQLHGASELKLDRKLTQMAQDWAQQLVNQAYLSNSGSTYQDVRLGENIFSRWSNTSVQVTGQEMVDHWYEEISKYKFGSEPTSVQGIGSFTQVIWAASQRIGVGFAKQPKDGAEKSPVKFIGVCLYYPPGNIIGHFKTNVKPIKS